MSKFREGDCVRLKREIYSREIFLPIGTHGKIIGITKSFGYEILFSFSGGTEIVRWAYGKDLELVKKEE